MNESWNFLYQIETQRRADLTRKAEKARLLQAATPQKPARHAVAMAFAGRMLIALGRELQARYDDAVLPEVPPPLAPTHDTSC